MNTTTHGLGFFREAVALANGPFAAVQDVLLIPKGVNALVDGTVIRIDREDADQVIANFRAKNEQLCFDLEHAQVLKAPRGEQADAYGWGQELSWSDQGLMCRVKWLPNAIALIESERYKYLSPTVLYEKESGRVHRVFNVGLVNQPALPNMPALRAASEHFLEKKMGLISKLLQEPAVVATAEQKIGEIKSLLEGMGVKLGDGADFVSILNAALERLQGKDKPMPEAETVAASVRKELGLQPDADGKMVLAALSDLKGHKGFVPADLHADLAKRLKALEDAGKESTAKALVEQCLSEGKLLRRSESQVKWAHDFAARDAEGFKTWSQGAPQIVPQGQTNAPDAGTTGRDGYIAKACSEYAAGGTTGRLTDCTSFVNQSLREKGMPLLSDEEKKRLVA